MGLFVPVVDQERARFERGSGGDDTASRAHRAFHDPHSLHRGSRPEDDTERDVGSQYAKKGNLVKVDGKWVKPSKDRDGRGSKPGVSHALGSEPQRFIPEKEFRGARLGYYFAMGKHGLGYYADDPRLYRSNQWRDTWEELRPGTRERDRRGARRPRPRARIAGTRARTTRTITGEDATGTGRIEGQVERQVASVSRRRRKREAAGRGGGVDTRATGTGATGGGAGAGAGTGAGAGRLPGDDAGGKGEGRAREARG